MIVSCRKCGGVLSSGMSGDAQPGRHCTCGNAIAGGIRNELATEKLVKIIRKIHELDIKRGHLRSSLAERSKANIDEVMLIGSAIEHIDSIVGPNFGKP